MTAEPLKHVQVLWAALVGGVVVYTAVFYGLVAFAGFTFDVLPSSVMNAVGTVVMVFSGVILMVRRGMVEKIPDDLPAADRIARYRSATLIPLAACEAGGLTLITTGLLADAATWILAGGAAVAVLMFMMRPTAAEIGLD